MLRFYFAAEGSGVAPVGVSGGTSTGATKHATRGVSCEACQSLQHAETCTRSSISHVTHVTRHSTVIHIVQPLAKE